MRDMLTEWLESKPHFGIVASLSGFFTSILAFMEDVSIILGFLGAVFGLLAGYYTWKIKREHWKRLVYDHQNKSDQSKP
jgi:hypothetical protein